ncbi:MAG: methylmalonyl Co-A mutase-associated GTPase MeaB [Acidimicrobiia bacterium]|nr:methylmalonyl Co-A mutase-associated GTPase MeaB [Acidimicrobiia bacterium]MDX2468857.1 methylmalonyl Co-A mutase-associated GTPase MeaB [Acidimicrobiia bacterium]
MARISDPAILIPKAIAGDRRSLARLITIVENGGQTATEVLAELFPAGGNAWTTGLTGAPGAGKSTLTDRIIGQVRNLGTEIAVVAVDPSSPFSGGAVLGDRVRMQDHIDDEGVYIRSMASRGHLGGIAAATPRVVATLDGIGFDEIVVETVGVGQAEVEIAGNADTTVVVVNPGWGDSVQAAKAGLLEIGDIFVVNKADRAGVSETVRDLTQMLELGEGGEWAAPVIPTVAATGDGVAELWEAIGDHRHHLEVSGQLLADRQRRLVTELESALIAGMRRQVRSAVPEPVWRDLTEEVTQRRIDPWSAAVRLLGELGVAFE